MKFTDSMIRALKPKEKRYEVWESRGFGLRITPSGEKSFVFLYRFQGKARRLTLGRYPGMSLTEAHAAHIEARQLIEQGTDPGAKKIEAKKIEREAFTVADLIEEYLQKWARPRKKTWQEDQRCLTRDVIPAIGLKKASEIRRRDIIGILDGIVDRGSPSMANRTMNVLTRLFNFAVTRDILDQSPCAALSLPSKKGVRERTLNEDEIRAIWFLENSGMTRANQLAMRLLLATGQRRGEVIGATWDEFDLETRLWSIPGARTKNGRNHAVPLNKLAMEVLGEIRTLSGETRFLFPSDRTVIHIYPRALHIAEATLVRTLTRAGATLVKKDRPATHIDPRALTRAMRKTAKEIGLQDVHVHDTRKTFATGLSSLQVERSIIKKCLNHQEKDVLAVHYDFFEYLDEKRRAMDIWARKLESIISGEPAGKIVALHTGRVAK